jgi:hypothetical protein
MGNRQPGSEPKPPAEKDAYASLIVRLWQCEPDWRSEVEHIQSGGTWTFATIADLTMFLNQFLHDLEGNT